MTKSKRYLSLSCLVIGATMGLPTSAWANGCNGVVNVFVWGCAPWDNNNGATFPYFRKRAITIPAAQAQIQKTKEGSYIARYQGQTYPLISQDGGGLVAQGAGNLVAQGAGNLNVWSPN